MFILRSDVLRTLSSRASACTCVYTASLRVPANICLPSLLVHPLLLFFFLLGFHDDVWLLRDQVEKGREKYRGGEEEEEADAVIQDFLEEGMTGTGLRDHDKGTRLTSSHLASSSSAAGETSSSSSSSSAVLGGAHAAGGGGVEMFTSVYSRRLDGKDTNQAACKILPGNEPLLRACSSPLRVSGET